MQTPPFPVAAPVLAVLERLWAEGHAAAIVGGAVRDALRGRGGKDWDVATDARPDRLLELFPRGAYFNRFGTVGLDGMEITTFRQDHRYADHRRPDTVTFTDDIDVDLLRRDLTINAIAWGRGNTDDAEPHFIDPADGRADLDRGIVRAVGDPDTRFDEDALRLLRAVRIAGRRGFTIEARTLSALRAHAGDIGWVSRERVGVELRRMLASERPSAALGILRATGLAGHVLPELAGEEDADHLEAVVDAVPARTEALRLAALLHGLATGAAHDAAARLGVGRDEARDIDVIASHVHAGPTMEGPELRRFMSAVGDDRLDGLVAVRRAHAAASADHAAVTAVDALAAGIARERVAGSPMTTRDLAIDGHDLRERIGIPDGPGTGRLLEALLEAVTENPELADRASLLDHARTLATGAGTEQGRHGAGPVRSEP